MDSHTLHCKRVQLGLTQKELAKQLCVSPASVSLWESGKRTFPLPVEKLFCLLYDIPFESTCSKSAFDNQPDLF